MIFLTGTSCTVGLLACGTSPGLGCYSSRQHCDGSKDCPNGADEHDCPGVYGASKMGNSWDL